MEIKVNKENEEKKGSMIEGFDMPMTVKPEIKDHHANFEFRNPRPTESSFGQTKSETGSKFPAPSSKETSDVRVTHGLGTAIWWWREASRWALLAMIGLAPLFFLPVTQMSVSANKEFLVFGAILLAFFSYLGKVLVEGKFRYPGHWLTITFGALVAVWFLSSFFSVNMWGSFIGTWSTFDSFAAVFLFSILAFLVASSFDRKDLVLSVLIFLGGLAVLGIYNILQLSKIFILPWVFTQSAAFNPVGTINDMTLLFGFGLILTVGLLASLELSSILRKLLGVSASIFLVNLMMVNFLYAWIGLVIAMIILIGFFSTGLAHGFKEGSQGLQLVYFRKAWLPTLILLIALLFIFIPTPLAKFVTVPAEVGLSHQATFDIGLSTVESGKFLLGSGPNTFWYDYNLDKPDSVNATIFWSANFSQGASVLGTWISTMGILGVLAVLVLLAVFFRTGLKAAALKQSTRSIANVLAQASFVSVIFMFIMWFLYNTNFTNLLVTFWGIGLFLASSLYFSYESGESQKSFREIALFTSPQKTFLLSLLIVALMVASVAAIYGEIERYTGEYYFSKALTANAAGDSSATIDNLSKSINFWPYDERYWQSFTQAIFFQLNTLFAQKNVPQDTLRAQFSNITGSAIQAAKQASSLNPDNPFNAVLLGSIYENLIPLNVAGSADFAVSSYAKAVSLDPKNPADYVAIARVYVAQADLIDAQIKGGTGGADLVSQRNAILAKAEPQLMKALNLKNDFAPARFLLVQVYDREGKTADAITHALEIVQLNPNDIGSLFQLGFLYYKNGEFDNARIVFEKVVSLSPNYSNARYFLGLIYDRQGDRAGAIAQFAQIANLNPDNQEVKQILANLNAKKPALFGIVPPPQNRTVAPVPEGTQQPVKPVKRK